MKTFSKFMTISSLVILLCSCTGGGGGVTTENDPTNPGGGNPQDPTPVFSDPLSSFVLLDHEGASSGNDLMGQQFKAVFSAKDTKGLAYEGSLSISVIVTENQNPQSTYDVALVHQGSGIYTANFLSNDPKQYSFRLKIGGVPKLDTHLFQVSACSNSETSTPREMVIESLTYKVICNTPQFLTIQNDLSGNYLIGKNIDLVFFYEDQNADNIPDNQFQFGPAAFAGNLKALGVIPPSISGYRYNGVLENNLGIFKELGAGSKVENIKIDQVMISGDSIIGGLAGSINDGAIVKNVSISSSITGNSYIGGLAGKINSSSSNKVSIENISSDLSMFVLDQKPAGNSYIGGIAGEITGNVEVSTISLVSLVLNQDYTTSSEIKFAGGVAGSIQGSPSPQNLVPKIKDLRVVSSNIRVRNGRNLGGVSGLFQDSEFTKSPTNFVTSQIAFYLSADINNNPVKNTGLIGGFSGDVVRSVVKNVSIILSTSGAGDPNATGMEKIQSKFSAFSDKINLSEISEISLYGFNVEIEQSNFSLFAEEVLDSALEKINLNFYIPIVINGSQQNISLFAKNFINSSLKKSELFVNPQLETSSSFVSLIENLNGSELSDLRVYLNFSADSEVALIANKAESSIIKNILIKSSIKANSSVYGISKEIKNTQLSHIVQLSSITNLAGNASPLNSSLAMGKSELGDTSSLLDFVYYTGDTAVSAYCLDSSCQTPMFTSTAQNNLDYFYNKNNSPYTAWDFSNIWEAVEDDLPYLKTQ